MKNFYLILLLFLFCFSCLKKQNDILDFPDEKELCIFDSISIDDVGELDVVSELGVVDSILIFRHGSKGDYRYSFWHRETGRQFRKWGVVGQGKDEFLDFGADLMLNDTSLMFYSWQQGRLYTVPLSFLVSQDESCVQWTSDSIPNVRSFRVSRILPFENFCVVLGGMASGKRLGIIDKSTCMYREDFDYPFDCGVVEGWLRNSVFQGELKANYRIGRFVVHTLASDIFEIYQVDDTTVTRVHVSSFQKTPVAKRVGERFILDSRKSAAGFFNLAVTDEWICFNVADGTYDDLIKQYYMSDEIVCFNWNGEKALKMKLPFKVDNFCLDSSFVYSIAYHGEDCFLYRFRYR